MSKFRLWHFFVCWPSQCLYLHSILPPSPPHHPPTFAGGKAAETMMLPHLQVISSWSWWNDWILLSTAVRSLTCTCLEYTGPQIFILFKAPHAQPTTLRLGREREKLLLVPTHKLSSPISVPKPLSHAHFLLRIYIHIHFSLLFASSWITNGFLIFVVVFLLLLDWP